MGHATVDGCRTTEDERTGQMNYKRAGRPNMFIPESRRTSEEEYKLSRELSPKFWARVDEAHLHGGFCESCGKQVSPNSTAKHF